MPLHTLLADFMQAWKQQTPYSQSQDWVFPQPEAEGAAARDPRTCWSRITSDRQR